MVRVSEILQLEHVKVPLLERDKQAVIGELVDLLADQGPGAGNEIQLTDAMKRLGERQDFFAMRYDGRTFDTGSKLGFLVANLAYGLEDETLGPQLRAEIKTLLED